MTEEEFLEQMRKEQADATVRRRIWLLIGAAVCGALLGALIFVSVLGSMPTGGGQ